MPPPLVSDGPVGRTTDMCHCRNVNMPHSSMKSLLLWVISAIARAITSQTHFLHRLFWLRVAKGPHMQILVGHSSNGMLQEILDAGVAAR